jgi:hypothetical protein
MTEKPIYTEFAIKKSWWLWAFGIVIGLVLLQFFLYGNSKRGLEAYIRNSKDLTSRIDDQYLKLQAGVKEVPGAGYVLSKNEAKQLADDVFYKEDIAYTNIGSTFFLSDISKCADDIHFDQMAQIMKLRTLSLKTAIDPAELQAAHEGLQASFNLESACLSKFTKQ